MDAFSIFSHYPIILPLALITLIGEMNYSGTNNISLPAYIRSLSLPKQLDGTVTGFIAASFLLSETIFRMPAGWLSDRFGRSKIIAGAFLLSAPSFLLSWLAPSYQWLFPLRFWDGMVAAAIWPSVYAIVGDSVPERHRANAMGVINMMYMLGLFLGFGLAGGIDKVTNNPRMYLLLSAIMGLLAGITALMYFHWRPQYTAPHPDVHIEEAEKAAISVSRHTILLLITFAQNLALTMVAPFMYRFATDSVASGGLGLSLSGLGLLVGIPVVGVAILAVPLSRIADVIGKFTAVRIAFTVIALTLWVFAVSKALWVLALVATVVGVAFSMGIPAWLAILTSLTGSKTRGTALGGYGTVQGIASVLGPIIAGRFLWGYYGHASIFIASSIVLAFAALLTLVALPEHRHSELT